MAAAQAHPNAVFFRYIDGAGTRLPLIIGVVERSSATMAAFYSPLG
jgi:hypothetical protein